MVINEWCRTRNRAKDAGIFKPQTARHSWTDNSKCGFEENFGFAMNNCILEWLRHYAATDMVHCSHSWLRIDKMNLYALSLLKYAPNECISGA